MKFNKTDFLLYSSNKNKLSSTQFWQYNNKNFWKNVSTNTYRHVYLTNFYLSPRTYMQMDEMSKFISHSINQSMLYVINDAEDAEDAEDKAE